MAQLVNKFKVGADPELVILDPPRVINGQVDYKQLDTLGLFGFDHGGFVVEPHPTPSASVRDVCKNIRAALDYLHYKFPDYKMRAGACIQTPQRALYMGGHVHLDMPDLSPDQIAAMDCFTSSLEGLDILPRAECDLRVKEGRYGLPGDIRREHGHVEYRSMCSWLFDPKIALLCMTGIKLAAVSPESLPVKPFSSRQRLTKWLEGFKEDDDVRWMFDKEYFSGDLTAKPDASLVETWKTSKLRGKALGEIHSIKKAASVVAAARRNALRNDFA